ncbi:MAG: glycosyltransferase family 39 protein [Acidimicrobiia bacterium]
MVEAAASPATKASRANHWQFWAILAGALLAAAILVRAPGLTGILFDRDEAHVAVEAQALARGEHLYEDVIDRKPPVVPVINAAIFEAFGTKELWSVRLVLAVWVAATGLVVAAIVVRRNGSRRASVVAGVLVVLGTVAFLPGDGQAANFELWGALPAAGAVLLALPRAVDERTRSKLAGLGALVGAGALVALAAACKQPYMVTIVPVGYFAVRAPRPIPRLAAVAGGGALVSIVLLAAFGTGQVRWAWLGTNDYLGGGEIVRGIFVLGPLMTVFFVASQIAAVGLAVRGVLGRWRDEIAILLWLVVALIAAAAGFRFLGHYYQQVLAPLGVLAGAGADRVSVRIARTAIGGAAGIAAVAVVVALLPVSDQREPVADAVAYVRANTDPDDSILVWGAFPEVYWRSDRRLAGGFVHHGFLTGFWRGDAAGGEAGDDDRWEDFVADLRADPPALVVDSSPTNVGEFERYPIAGSPLEGFLEDEGYSRVGVFDGMPIWQRPT